MRPYQVPRGGIPESVSSRFVGFRRRFPAETGQRLQEMSCDALPKKLSWFAWPTGSTSALPVTLANATPLNHVCTGVPRSSETPTPKGSPEVPRHRATVESYGGGGSHEQGTPVAPQPPQWSAPPCRGGKEVPFPAEGNYRGTSLIRNSPPLAPCSRTMPWALCWS